MLYTPEAVTTVEKLQRKVLGGLMFASFTYRICFGGFLVRQVEDLVTATRDALHARGRYNCGKITEKSPWWAHVCFLYLSYLLWGLSRTAGGRLGNGYP